MKNLYRAELKEIVNKSVNDTWLLPEIKKIAARIRDDVKDDPLLKDRDIDNFDRNVGSLKNFARKRKTAIRAQLEE